MAALWLTARFCTGCGQPCVGGGTQPVIPPPPPAHVALDYTVQGETIKTAMFVIVQSMTLEKMRRPACV